MTKTKTEYIDKQNERLKCLGGTSGEENHFMFGCSQCCVLKIITVSVFIAKGCVRVMVLSLSRVRRPPGVLGGVLGGPQLNDRIQMDPYGYV